MRLPNTSEIVPLPQEKWKGTDVPIRYTTDAYFDLELTESESAFSARMVKKQFETPVTHTPEEYDFPDKLYQDYWEKAEAYGIVGADGALLACIELCPEEWSNRLLVTELWVADQLHRKGIGTRLMNLAKEKAKEQGRRAIILETQSCNVRAIAFYRSQDTLDECPMAYKDPQTIISAIGDTVRIEKQLRPIYNFKSSDRFTSKKKK